ncbi:MAG TPA: lipopolysaccharide biosynthesis protein [Allosphingosinicella sp.]|nr:lipopolysaccharide biosynthesis protein [Allosphingosinicella sp.]
MTAAPAAPADDIAALARGGRTNFFGFVLRLAARLPFLFIAGRLYGPELLGRFAYAVIVVEFAAQVATLGLKRGLAQQLAETDQPHVCIVFDAMLAALIASAAASILLIGFPQAVYPPHGIMHGSEWLLPLIVFPVAGCDIALAALAYRHNVRATVTARALVEPWTISIGAGLLYFITPRDGLIIAYALSEVAALAAALVPLLRSYGFPRGWRPHPGKLLAVARRNVPLAAADAIEWGSRRLDIAILSLLLPVAVAPFYVGVYYIAQQVATLPQKLKTSFDPILAPVITKRLAEGNRPAVARQVRQVGFWIVAAQTGVALALGIPAKAVMGLIGAKFVAGTAALVFLLGGEIAAATAAVSESALVYVARHRNLTISLLVIAVEAVLAAGFILATRAAGLPESWQAASAALALLLALGLGSILKARLLSRLLEAQVQPWRWPLFWAAAGATLVGWLFSLLPASLVWIDLAIGVPGILATFTAIVWKKGFTAEDRILFRFVKAPETPEP